MIASRRLAPPVAPMEAKSVADIPTGKTWQYEPKWDGFRCLAFRRGRRVQLQSKSGQPLQRYFPEVVEALLALKPTSFVLDGEIIVVRGGRLSFDDLLQRIHPAASRVAKLAQETPATYMVFDLLEGERGRALLEMTLMQRRERLTHFARRYLRGNEAIRLSPATGDIKQARRWFSGSGAALDGIIAKSVGLPYQSGNRNGMQKIKRRRTAECVVGGFRFGSKDRLVGSLLLGLYDDKGILHHVGFTSSFRKAERADVTRKVLPLRQSPHAGGGFTGSAPGGPSRWSTERSSEWEPVSPALVVEVEWEHFSEGRFRHGTRFLRWRPDKAPKSCTMDQVQHKAASVRKILSS